MTPKEALVKDGKVETKIGRGRLSAAQTARVLELVGMGWDIKGYAKSTSSVPAAPVAVKKVVKSDPTTDCLTLDDMRFPEASWKAVTTKGIEVSMRTACWCGYSLVGHICDEPKGLVPGFVDHQPLLIVPR